MKSCTFHVLLTSLVVMAMVVGCSKQDAVVGPIDQQDGMQVVEVMFDQPVDLIHLSDLLGTDIHVVQVRATMVDNQGGEHTYGQSYADDEVANVATIHDEAIALFDHQAQIDQQVIDEAKAEGKDPVFVEPVVADKKVVQVGLNYLMIELTVDQRNDVEPALRELGARTQLWEDPREEQPTSQLEMRAASDWVPNIGNVTTGKRSSTTRYAYHRLRWQNDNPFDRWETYEHDFFLNNYSTNRGTYFSRAQNSLGFPVCTWTSNFPAAYLDTRIGDPSTEVAYTIGCGDAYKFNERVWYTSTIYVKNGDVSTDVGKLTAQLGNQVPVGCTSVWCSYGVANQRLIKAWEVEIPGSQWWYYG